jgi:hypothetical protein
MGGARVGEDGEVLVAIHDEAITPTVSINKKRGGRSFAIRSS